MQTVLILVIVVPLLATLTCLVLPKRASSVVTVVAGISSLILALVLLPTAAHQDISIGFLRVDALSMVFLLATAFLYATTAVYTIGYLGAESDVVKAKGGADALKFARYCRKFYVGLNAFAWSMLCAPAVDGLALLWIAIEITTVVSALLVAVDDTDGASEAAWKYVLIASCGLGIGLLATIMMYFAGSEALGDSYDLSFDPLLANASALAATPVRLAFVLAVVGFGTKVGLFPVHTWLPDAHAEAPTPVSVLLSGALLATSFYAILRYFQIAVGAVGPNFPRTVLLVFGVLSLSIAALYVLEQADIKRLLAYSSVEHMGILAIGASFGAPIALTGVLLHVLAHAAAKGSAFMAAGVVVRAFGTKELDRIRGGINRLPWTGPLLLLCIFALSALPPFGLFRSEFQIVAGGFADRHQVAASILVVLVTLAFFGLTAATTKALFVSGAPGSPQSPDRLPLPVPVSGEDDREPVAETGAGPHQTYATTAVRPASAVVPPDRSEPSVWMVVPIVVGVLVAFVLGVYLPHDLVALFARGAAELSGVPL